MLFREATSSDIPQIQRVRHTVKENRLSDPALVTDADCDDYITKRGKGWVCEVDQQIVAFAIVSLTDHNVWALFVDPAFEKRGIGKQLHHIMLSWYFSQTNEPIWLSTDQHTRAERFYRIAGWQAVGFVGKTEVKFEMTYDQWIPRHHD